MTCQHFKTYLLEFCVDVLVGHLLVPNAELTTVF